MLATVAAFLSFPALCALGGLASGALSRRRPIRREMINAINPAELVWMIGALIQGRLDSAQDIAEARSA